MNANFDLTYTKTFLEKNKDWKKYISEKHHKYIDSLISFNFDIDLVAKEFYLTSNDINAVFGIIVKTLQEEAFKEELFSDVSRKKRDKLILIINQSAKYIAYLDDIYPQRLALIIQTLIETKDLNTTSKELNIGKSHIISRVLGRSKPRKPCEHGAIFYLKSYFEKIKSA